MGCNHVREALSARLDGEDLGVDGGTVDRHVKGCATCAAWIDELRALHRLVRVREAEAVPDLTEAILATAATGRRSSSPSHE